MHEAAAVLRCSASHVTLPTFISRLRKKNTHRENYNDHSAQHIWPMMATRGKKFAKIIPASWDVYHLVLLFIFIRIPVGRCYCFRFALYFKGPTFVYFFAASLCLSFPICFDFVIWKKNGKKINHVINFDISACERCEIQQWPNTICLLRDLVCWERINWRPTRTYCKQRTAINEWVEKKPTVTD